MKKCCIDCGQYHHLRTDVHTPNGDLTRHQSKVPSKNKERHLLIAHRYPKLKTGEKKLSTLSQDHYFWKKSFLNTFNYSAAVSTGDSRLLLSCFALSICCRSSVNSISQFKDTCSLQWETRCKSIHIFEAFVLFWQEGVLFQWKTGFQTANYKVVVKDRYFKGLLGTYKDI